ncbi:MAG: hypothetical protein F6K22_39190 [Okeania sp. SIO2F4]|uniref:hypothetical protein n=1 Tax=Okeania sp. SIO2F4 TaxID=2607790 RepID=UPI00142AEC6C|nr:hypothetical protein [Okeania sp. SIO2F4]NES08269.1 hypothetical protein [Okeania sp. SIO2F4]
MKEWTEKTYLCCWYSMSRVNLYRLFEIWLEYRSYECDDLSIEDITSLDYGGCWSDTVKKRSPEEYLIICEGYTAFHGDLRGDEEVDMLSLY